MTSLHADEAFLEHYQFSHDPFASRVPGFKFFPAQRKPVLGQLHHLARYSQLLLLVSGPKDSGKTLLRQALVASTNKQTVQNLVISAQGAVESGALLRQVAQGLQVAQADLSSILARVGQLALSGQEVYVLVDDAQQLGDSALDTLLALAAGNAEGRPHVFLFAEADLIARLERLSEGEERFHVIELQPYEEDETREYLAQRLDGAGQGLELLSDEQVAAIHEQSGGWPGRINQVARELLIDEMLTRRSSGRRSGLALSLPRKHLLALAVVAVGILAAWLMQGGKEEPVTEPPVASQSPQPGQVAVPPASAPAQGGQGPAVEFSGSNQPLPLPLVGQSQPVIRQPLAQAAGSEGEENLEAPGTPAGPSPEPAQAPAVTPAVPAPSPVGSTATAPAPTVQAPSTPAPAPAPKPAPAAKAPAAVAQPKPAPGSDWYASQAASRYTLQVFGTASEGAAQAFVRENGGEYRYFRKQHQGKPLFVVTYGSFASRDAAQAALKKLPAKVQAGKPWPRSFASVRQDIGQAR